MAPPQVLITGFEPFGQFTTNPSQEVAEALGARPDWHAVTLPVDFSRAVPQMQQLVREYRPQVVLSLGLAPGREEISFERVAINLIDARIPDNTGSQPVDQPVVPGGPSAYFTTLPVKAMCREVQDQGVEARLSLSAGTYGCNAVMYAALHASAPPVGPHATSGTAAETVSRAGFIHLPPAENLSIDSAVAAVQVAADCALRTSTDLRVAAGAID